VQAPTTDDDLASEFWLITKDVALSRREAVALLAQRRNIPARQVYAAIERVKKLGR
jgi:hypothetical protein